MSLNSDCPSFALYDTLRFQGSQITDYMLSAALGPLVLLDLRFNEDDDQLGKALLTFPSLEEGVRATEFLDSNPEPDAVDALLATVSAAVLDRSPITAVSGATVYGTPQELPPGVQSQIWVENGDFALKDHLDYYEMFDPTPPPAELPWDFQRGHAHMFLLFNGPNFLTTVKHAPTQSRRKAFETILEENLLVELDPTTATVRDNIVIRAAPESFNPGDRSIVATQGAPRLLGESVITNSQKNAFNFYLKAVGRPPQAPPADPVKFNAAFKAAEADYLHHVEYGPASPSDIAFMKEVKLVTGRPFTFDIDKATKQDAKLYINSHKREFHRIRGFVPTKW